VGLLLVHMLLLCRYCMMVWVGLLLEHMLLYSYQSVGCIRHLDRKTILVDIGIRISLIWGPIFLLPVIQGKWVAQECDHRLL